MHLALSFSVASSDENNEDQVSYAERKGKQARRHRNGAVSSQPPASSPALSTAEGASGPISVPFGGAIIRATEYYYCSNARDDSQEPS
jgi:hypothetical protein